MDDVGSTKESLAFTGERVVPNAVEPQLWNEHVSRYHFARQFASGKQVLDIGCGAGYGTDALAEVAGRAIGLDISLDAIAYARANYAKPEFLVGSAEGIPLASHSFHVITAFEVIEHLTDWQDVLAEAERLLSAEGVFLVSTPNKEYYAETRAEVGPNPFHVHEFDGPEFAASLRKNFRYITILTQNQSEAIVFAAPEAAVDGLARVPPAPSLSTAHFFLAVCSHQPINVANYSYVSDSGNLLRTREHHIRLLQEDVRETHEQHLRLLAFHDELHRVLDERTKWSAELQETLRLSETQLQAARDDLQQRTAEGQSNAGGLKTAREALRQVQHELQAIRGSKWLRLGRAFGLGPTGERSFHPRRFARSSIRKVREALIPRLQKSVAAGKAWILYVAAFPAIGLTALALLLQDVAFWLFGRRRLPQDTAPRHHAASIVIPNWNGCDLLQRFLPSVVEAAGRHPGSEVIVVDNASEDHSTALLRSLFPSVRVLPMTTNLGFAKAANAGVEAARNEVVVLLNNDMRVEENFLSELLPPFNDPLMFATSSQIFLGDKSKRREETGLTEVWWDAGRLRVGHRIDEQIRQPFPCAYPGGGSSAFDRKKFLELGGFDSLFEPFYYEDTDLGRMAWARGWKALYVPASVVHHEHRGTIGRSFSRPYIDGVVRINSLLYSWKNVANWRLLSANFARCVLSLWATRTSEPQDVLLLDRDARHLFGRLRHLLRSRWHAKQLRVMDDQEAWSRPLGGYYRDRFQAANEAKPVRLNVLFAAPYPIAPPVHGGAVLMLEAVAGLRAYADVHLVSFVDSPDQLEAQQSLLRFCQTALFLVRPPVSLENQWTLQPNAIREFHHRDFAWALHRTLYLQRIDVLQLEYTMLGQYGKRYQHIPCMLFEHDISTQSLWRRWRLNGSDGKLLLEFCRMRLYEPRLLKHFTRVQVCSDTNARSLLRLARAVRGKVDANVRAGIAVSEYPFTTEGREPGTLLFIGSFRHAPNVDALRWFIAKVLPLVVVSVPGTTLSIAGSDPPEDADWLHDPQIHLLGRVPDVKDQLQRYAVFICPILSGSGVRIKLLEAFAMGIPAVSTSIGAEGIAESGHAVCEIADSAEQFAGAVIRLLTSPGRGRAFAYQAREEVERRWDSRATSARLAATYNREVSRLRGTGPEEKVIAKTAS